MTDTTPTTPGTAALALLAQHVRTLLHSTQCDSAVAEICAMLARERTLTGLGSHDAEMVAARIAYGLCRCSDVAAYLRNHAREALSGADGIAWRDREQAAQAFTTTAAVLGV